MHRPVLCAHMVLGSNWGEQHSTDGASQGSCAQTKSVKTQASMSRLHSSTASNLGWVLRLWSLFSSILASQVPIDGLDESDGEFIFNHWMRSVQNAQTMVIHAPAAASKRYIENLAHSTAHAPATLQPGEYVQELAAAAADMIASFEASR